MADQCPTIRTEEEVMFFDTDCGAVVHNLAYLRFIETARTRLAALLGMDLRQMSETQIFPVLVRTEVDYRRSARLGDKLVIDGEIELFERSRFWCRFTVTRPVDETLLVTCRQSLALVQMPEARPKRLPKEWLERYPELGRNPDSKGKIKK
jgi:YbgC/YbaW family acyl-CoA thioester hydrolase